MSKNNQFRSASRSDESLNGNTPAQNDELAKETVAAGVPDHRGVESKDPGPVSDEGAESTQSDREHNIPSHVPPESSRETRANSRPIDNTDPVSPEPVLPKGLNRTLNARADEDARLSRNVQDSEEGERPDAKSDVVDNSGKWGMIEDRRFALDEDGKRVRKHLASQDLVRMMIPRSEGESKDSTQFYNINGFAFHIRKGTYVNVPEDIAKMIEDTYGQDQRLVDENPMNLRNNQGASNEFSRK